MIANGIKLVQLGALICALLPMMNLESVEADSELSERDKYIVKTQIELLSDEQLDQMQILLESVDDKNRAKIGGVSVKRLLALTEKSFEDCNLRELFQRFAIQNKVRVYSENMDEFVRHHLQEYVNFCFNNVDKISTMISEQDQKTVESAYRIANPGGKELETDEDDDEFEAKLREHLLDNGSMEDNLTFDRSCKSVTKSIAALDILKSYLNDGQAKDAAMKLRRDSGAIYLTCFFWNKKLFLQLNGLEHDWSQIPDLL